MRSTTAVPVAVTANKTAPNSFIPATADLSITITINAERQSHAPIKYRAVQRSDGVVVERPRYQPAALPLQRAERKPMASGPPVAPPSMTRHEALIKRMNKDLEAVGSSWEALSDACTKARTANCRRDGSNQPHDNARRFYKRTSVPDNSSNLMLERYLSTDGPWSVYELRER